MGKKLLFPVIFVIIAGAVVTQLYGFLLVPDEFGYVAHAARFIGEDWSGVSAGQPWYGPGIGILYSLILKFCKDPVICYRLFACLQCVFVICNCAQLVLLGRLFGCSKEKSYIIGVSGGVYCSALIYMQTAMAECLMILLFTSITVELTLFVLKRKPLSLFIAVLLTGYLYVVHIRSIGVIAVLSLIILISSIWMIIRYYHASEITNCFRILFFAMISLGVIAISIIALSRYRTAFEKSLAVAAGSYEGDFNGYTGTLGNLIGLFQGPRLLLYLCEACGKLLYICCSTFGIAAVGAVWVIRKLVDICKSRSLPEDSGELARISAGSFSLFCFLTMALLTSINSVYDIYRDMLFYGRYSEFTVFPLIVVGLSVLLEQESLNRFRKQLIIIMTVLFIPTFITGIRRDMGELRMHSVIGIAHAYKLSEILGIEDTLAVYICGMTGILLLFFFLDYLGKRGLSKSRAPYIVYIAFQLLLVIVPMREMVIPTQAVRREVAENLKAADGLLTGRPVVLFHMQEEATVDMIQFAEKNTTAEVVRRYDNVTSADTVINEINNLPKDACIFTDSYLTSGEEVYLSSRFANNIETTQFTLWYNEQ